MPGAGNRTATSTEHRADTTLRVPPPPAADHLTLSATAGGQAVAVDRLGEGATGGENAFPLRFRTLHGYRRAYVQTGPLDGTKPVLLLVHGIGQDSSTWSEVLPDLARDHVVIAPDLLGHGASAKPRADYAVGAYACGLRDLLTVLGVDRVTVVGHSLGGGVAMQFAYQFPERCERLVLISSGGAGREVHPLLRMASVPGAELVMPLATAAPVRRLARLLAGLVGGVARVGGALTQDLEFMLASYDKLARATTRRAFLRTLRSVVDVH